MGKEMEIKKELIIKLREKTQAGVMDARRALIEAKGDLRRAEELLGSWGVNKAAKKADRVTGSGVIEAYTHGDGKIGVMVELACETDFVAKTAEFKSLAHELALQIAAMDPTSVDELLSQEFIKDPSRSIRDLVTATIAKTGENVQIKRFQRFVLGS
jgi:elongation factor Ts